MKAAHCWQLILRALWPCMDAAGTKLAGASCRVGLEFELCGGCSCPVSQGWAVALCIRLPSNM